MSENVVIVQKSFFERHKFITLIILAGLGLWSYNRGFNSAREHCIDEIQDYKEEINNIKRKHREEIKKQSLIMESALEEARITSASQKQILNKKIKQIEKEANEVAKSIDCRIGERGMSVINTLADRPIK